MSELRKHDVVCKKPRFGVCVRPAQKTCMCVRARIPKGSDALSFPRSTLRGLGVAALYGKWLIKKKESSMERKTYGG